MKYDLISADSHLEIDAKWWRDRVPAAYRDQAPRVVRLPDGSDAWLIEGQPLRQVPFDLYGGKGRDVWKPFGQNYETTPGTGTAEQRLKEQDQDGIDAEVLFPGQASGPNFWRNIRDDNVYKACVRAYNDFLAEDYCSTNPDRLLALGVIPMTNLQDALDELEHIQQARPQGHRAVLLPERQGPAHARGRHLLESRSGHAHADLRPPGIQSRRTARRRATPLPETTGQSHRAARSPDRPRRADRALRPTRFSQRGTDGARRPLRTFSAPGDLLRRNTDRLDSVGLRDGRHPLRAPSLLGRGGPGLAAAAQEADGLSQRAHPVGLSTGQHRRPPAGRHRRRQADLGDGLPAPGIGVPALRRRDRQKLRGCARATRCARWWPTTPSASSTWTHRVDSAGPQHGQSRGQAD